MDGQQEFTFDRTERFAALRAATWMPRNVAQLIEAIETSPTAPSVAYLEARMRRSARSVRYAIKAAVDAGILVVEARVSSKGCQLANKYQIDWRAIIVRNRGPQTDQRERMEPPAREDAEIAAYPAKIAGYVPAKNAALFQVHNDITSPPPSTLVSARGSGCAVAEEEGDFEDSFSDEGHEPECEADTMKATSEPVQPQPSTPLFDRPEDKPLWDKARRRLVQCGLAFAQKAAVMARNRGWTPAGVLAACEHFLTHRGAWQAGALFARLRDADPEIDAGEGWPKPSPGYLDEQRREAEIERRRTERRAMTEGERRMTRERERRSALEARYGARLDALDAAAFAAEVAKIAVGEFLFKAAGRKGPLLRSFIFERWESQRDGGDQ